MHGTETSRARSVDLAIGVWRLTEEYHGLVEILARHGFATVTGA